jgi:hypothetical protein
MFAGPAVADALIRNRRSLFPRDQKRFMDDMAILGMSLLISSRFLSLPSQISNLVNMFDPTVRQVVSGVSNNMLSSPSTASVILALAVQMGQLYGFGVTPTWQSIKRAAPEHALVIFVALLVKPLMPQGAEASLLVFFYLATIGARTL